MYDFVSEHGTVSEKELSEFLNSKTSSGEFSAYCQYTTAVTCEKYTGKINDTAHLLEIRLFNSECEIRAVRSVIGKPFIWRIINDEKFKANLKNGETFEERTYTEKQYLDIDSTKTDGKNYHFIGGGKYTLPIENAEKLEIINYGVYDENGIFGLVDFRIVRLLAKGEK